MRPLTNTPTRGDRPTPLPLKAAMIITLSHLALFLFQTEDAAPPPAAIGHASGAAIVDMVRNSGPIALGVLVLLLIASLYSWGIILGKLASFKLPRVQSGRSVRACP